MMMLFQVWKKTLCTKPKPQRKKKKKKRRFCSCTSSSCLFLFFFLLPPPSSSCYSFFFFFFFFFSFLQLGKGGVVQWDFNFLNNKWGKKYKKTKPKHEVGGFFFFSFLAAFLKTAVLAWIQAITSLHPYYPSYLWAKENELHWISAFLSCDIFFYYFLLLLLLLLGWTERKKERTVAGA